MGCTVSKAAARSRKIDEGLRADMRMREREVKLLLLGKSDSLMSQEINQIYFFHSTN